MSQQESRINKRIYAAFKLVPGVGVEPTHLAVSDFESDASANFAIRANQKGKPMKKNFPIFYKNKF